MKTDLAYVVCDLRQTDCPLGGVARIATIPGGFAVQDTTGRAQKLFYDDEYPESLKDESEAGILEIRTDKGRVILEAVNLANWRDDLEPFFDTPNFQTDEEAQAWFAELLREGAR